MQICYPSLARNERKFRDHPDVEFVFISTLQSTEEAYNEYVEKYLLDEDVHLVCEDEFNLYMELFK